MQSPWLNVPLADYEGHMQSAAIQQLGVLSELFAESLRLCQPESLAILGVAGGNGLEHIDSARTRRIVGIDIHPEYLETVQRRFAHLPGLDLQCFDLAAQRIAWPPVEMVYAALVFEHAGTALCLENALALVAPKGWLAVVLQRPSRETAGVGASPFPSIQKLKPNFTLVDPAWFQDAVRPHGFSLKQETERALTGGKGFWVGLFRHD